MQHEERLKGVDPILIEFVKKLDAVCPILVVFGYRSIAEQNELYAQGRTKPGKIVTNAKGGRSPHNYSAAVDLAPTPLDWSDTNRFNNMVQEAKKIIDENDYEITCGADFKSIKDLPHFELTNWRKRK